MANPNAAALGLLAAACVTEALGELLKPVLAHGLTLLLTICGWRPASPYVAADPQTKAPTSTVTPAPARRPATGAASPRPELRVLTVRELRHLARTAGLRALARDGRRAQLLEALA